jgi:hypothetical protein
MPAGERSANQRSKVASVTWFCRPVVSLHRGTFTFLHLRRHESLRLTVRARLRKMDVVEQPDRSRCEKCGGALRITAERDGLVFYTCESCGTCGAYSLPSKRPGPQQ